MARTVDEGCGCGVRTLETLRCPADAVLSREHADQSRGKRRRGMFRTRGTRTDSELAVLVTDFLLIGLHGASSK